LSIHIFAAEHGFFVEGDVGEGDAGLPGPSAIVVIAVLSLIITPLYFLLAILFATASASYCFLFFFCWLQGTSCWEASIRLPCLFN